MRKNCSKMILVTIVVMGLACLPQTGELAYAGAIDVPLTGRLSGFGDTGEQYRGQTFIALPGLAQELTFFVGPTFDFPGVSFHVLLTEIDTTNGIHPTNVLFESATLTVPLFPINFDPTQFTVDLGSLSLVAGQKYAWLLDAFVVRDNIFSIADVGIDLTGSYADGEVISLPLGPFPSGTRSDHFRSNWYVQSNIDLAFSLMFTPSVVIPEPSTIALFGTGLVGLIGCHWRRRKRTAGAQLHRRGLKTTRPKRIGRDSSGVSRAQGGEPVGKVDTVHQRYA